MDRLVSLFPATKLHRSLPAEPIPALSVRDAEAWVARALAELDEANALNALLALLPATGTADSQAARRATVEASVERVTRAKADRRNADAALRAAWNRVQDARHRNDLWDAYVGAEGWEAQS